MKATFDEVISTIVEEREYQNALWGPTSSQGNHSITEFLVYINDYTQEALHKASRFSDSDARIDALHSIRKIITLGVACMEQNGVCRRDMSDLDNACRDHGVCIPE